MLYALVVMGLFAYAVADLVKTPASAVRTLPKPLWFVVVLPPLFGPLAWLLFGRARRPRGNLPPAPPARPVAPDDDEDFLRDLRRRSRDPRDDAA
ncbi:MAG: PLDc N-terminal domain-containing protein [Actinomycetota bacterium]|nr:PLDc N-terminal domain-containing protein [Actinomycetota bacterium]